MTLTCPICGEQFTYSYKHRKYCSRACQLRQRYERNRERRRNDPNYAEKQRQYRERRIQRINEHAEQAVAALDDEARDLLAFLFGEDDEHDSRLLETYYDRPTLFGMLEEIERREDAS